tara:strand:+ start:391 stop:534 length:144 start_codon:yes stop_codon:yes gene_type:complete
MVSGTNENTIKVLKEKTLFTKDLNTNSLVMLGQAAANKSQLVLNLMS